MKTPDEFMPVAGPEEGPLEMVDLGAWRVTIGEWIAGCGPHAVFVCQLLPSHDADAEVEIRLETKDHGVPAAKGAPETLLPVASERAWSLRGRGVHLAEYVGLRDLVRFVYSIRSADLGPIRVRMMRAAWSQAPGRFVWTSPWIPRDPHRAPARIAVDTVTGPAGPVRFRVVHAPESL